MLRTAFVLAALGLPATALAPAATVETVAGSVKGELVRISPKVVVVKAAAERSIELGSVISIGFDGGARLADAKVTAFLAAGPGRAGGAGLLCEITSAGEDRIVLNSAAFGELSVPIAELSGMVLPGANAKQRKDIAAEIASGKAPVKDRLYLPNGDRMEGLITKVSSETVTFEGMLGELDYSLQKLAGVLFGEASRRPAGFAGLHAAVVASTGEAIAGVPEELADGHLRLKTAYGSSARIALSDVRSVLVRGGRAVPLAGLSPVRSDSRPLYEGEPPIWPKLKSSGRSLVLRPHSTVVYDLAGRYERLTAKALVRRRDGSVSLRMLADGREVLNIEKLTGGDGARAIDVALAGARRLVIVCGFGPEIDDAGDALELGGAHLVKPKEAK